MFSQRTIKAGLAAILTVSLGISLASCGGRADASSPLVEEPVAASSAESAAALYENEAAGPTTVDVTVAAEPSPEAGTATEPATVGSGVLSAAEEEALYWMREEEKLARDVYLAMFDLWGLQAFENIAASEARHMEAVLGLIEAYGLEDPVLDDTPGSFRDPELAALYHELVSRGEESLVEALTVGALIEDLDILDLEERSEATDRADIVRVFENLKRGSQNHLRAFTTRLAAEGAVYEPVYHTEEELAALLAGTESGGGRGPGRARGGRSR
ncbi:MAG: DUF2202 domain-containing protein [Acidimicrobiia bacterium]|nr:DUF2202 domain-containing protein [Acidimicrobiia bacterium]